MAHSQRSIRDHARERHQPHVEVDQIAEHLEDLLTPAIYAQQGYYRQLGMCSRILTLPLMVAAVLTLLWRNVPSVRELNRMLARENLLWASAVKVSQSSLSERFLTFPAELFEGVLKALLPVLSKRMTQRRFRPLPESILVARGHFPHIWIADGSTLEALFRKLKSLEDVPLGQLAGKICAVIDLTTRLPVEVGFCTAPHTHETQFRKTLLSQVSPGTLLVLDRGFWDYSLFANIIDRQGAFITRLKNGAKYVINSELSTSWGHRDRLICLGTGYQGNPILTLRLIEIRQGQTWYRYLTSELDPRILPPYVVADLYGRRWRIEESFYLLKRLLGLSYLWTGSANGIKLQIWATWLFYAVLIDLGDEVADAFELPFERISLEMLWRSFYHFVNARTRGETQDWLSYILREDNQDLGVVKPLRQGRLKPPIDLSPAPGDRTLD